MDPVYQPFSAWAWHKASINPKLKKPSFAICFGFLSSGRSYKVAPVQFLWSHDAGERDENFPCCPNSCNFSCVYYVCYKTPPYMELHVRLILMTYCWTSSFPIAKSERKIFNRPFICDNWMYWSTENELKWHRWNSSFWTSLPPENYFHMPPFSFKNLCSVVKFSTGTRCTATLIHWSKRRSGWCIVFWL